MKRTFLRGLLMNATGSASVAGVALVRNVLIARVMGPAAFGLWQICLVALRLAGESHLGALHALSLDAPVHRGAGRDGQARALEGRALAVALALALLSGLAAAAVLRLEGGPSMLVAAPLLGAVVVLQQLFLADAILLRTRRQFGRMALLQLTFAAVHLAGLLLLLPDRYLTGALVAWGAGVVAAVGLVRLLTPDPLPLPRPDALRAVGPVLRRGLPAYLVGVTFVLLLQVDRVVVAALLEREQLGYYGFLLLGGSAVLFLPDVVAGVLWPYAGEAFGRSGEDAASLAPMAVRTLRSLGLLLSGVVVLAMQATEILVATDLVAPELRAYRPALEALRLYMPGIFLLSLLHPLRFVLLTAGADRSVLRAQGGILVLAAAAEAGAALAGGGIAGVALAGSASAAALFAVVLVLAARVLRLGSRAGRLAVETGLLLGGAMALDAALSRFGPDLSTPAGALGRLVVPGLFAVGVGIHLLRGRTAGLSADGDAWRRGGGGGQ